MINIKKIYTTFKDFSRQLSYDHVGAYAAWSSFFIIISIFPILMLLLALLRYTPVTEQFLLESVLAITPSNLDGLFQQIINEMYHQSNFAIISVTALTALWSSSRAVLSVIRGLNAVFGIDENRNYIFLRIVAVFYTLIFLFLIIISLGIMVFGNTLLEFFHNHITPIYNIFSFLLSLRMIYIPIIFTVAFIYLYRIVPNRNYSFTDHLPGATFTAVGWITFSSAYSFYIDNFASSTYIYGSLTTVVLLMLWIYFCMYILFIGAEINIQFKEDFRDALAYIKDIHSP